MYKKSGNPVVEELTKSVRNRSYNLSCLRAIKTDQLNEKGRPVRLCAWCSLNKLVHGNQKYCSQECANSSMAWAYPQKEDALRYLLIRQNFLCAHCSYDYKPFLEEMIERDRIRRPHTKIEDDIERLPWHYFKRLKARIPEGHGPEVDHVLAISKGGTSLGLENHQILCKLCHRKKTSVDLSGKRKIK